MRAAAAVKKQVQLVQAEFVRSRTASLWAVPMKVESHKNGTTYEGTH